MKQLEEFGKITMKILTALFTCMIVKKKTNKKFKPLDKNFLKL